MFDARRRGTWIARFLVLAVWLVPAVLHAATATVFAVDAASSTLRVEVGRGGLFAFAGHDHRVLATEMSGRVEVTPGDWTAAKVTLTLAAAGLEVDPEVEPEDDLAEVQANMTGERCLDSAKYPEIRFESTEVRVDSVDEDRGLKVVIVGHLTLHGVTHEVKVPVEVRPGAGELTAEGRFEIRQKDYGITPISAAAGTVKVKNELAIEFMIRCVAGAQLSGG